MRRASWLVAAGILAVSAACHHGQGDEPYVNPGIEPVTVRVVNNYALPVEIEAVGSGSRYRLGTVHPGMSATFTIPPALRSTTTVELLARSSGTRRIGRSGPLMLSPGSEVEFTVTTQMFDTSADVHQ